MHAARNTIHNYQCRKCRLVRKENIIPSSYNCEEGGLHVWNDLGLAGRNTYYCKGCRTTLRSKFKPRSTGCINGTDHVWKLKLKPRAILLAY